jgi:3,4-dihydroxy 2-butanone 4-phosphate synthase/GTP cyclohydrolase II
MWSGCFPRGEAPAAAHDRDTIRDVRALEQVTQFAAIEEAIEEIREGRFVVVVDAPERENEGDLVIAAQFATPEAVNFMTKEGRGLICLCLTEERCDELGLRQMTDRNETPNRTAFTVSIEAREGITTGISAPDRSRTIQVAVDPSSGPQDLVQPGHVFPLRARRGGVLERAGQTEAAVDLARLAGLIPAGVVCEVMAEDGTMARVPDLIPYCERHGIKLVTVADLIEYRRRHEQLVERMVSVRLPTSYGEFTAIAFREKLTGKHHVALVRGEVDGAEDVLVRVHSECLTGDVFHSLRCDCGQQLEDALAKIEDEGRGVLLYLAQEGRGIGLLNKLRAYKLQEEGLDTVDANLELGLPADLRDYGIGAQILVDLGLSSIRLLTNNPKKIVGLEGYGLRVTDQLPIMHAPGEHNRAYLRAKRDRLGHLLHHQGLALDEEMIHEERVQDRARERGRTERGQPGGGGGSGDAGADRTREPRG